MKFGYIAVQSRMVEGVSLRRDGDFTDWDDLLREAVRVALRMHVNADGIDDWDDLYDRIRTLLVAYVESPDGVGEDTETLMARFAACIADVIPLEVRKELVAKL